MEIAIEKNKLTVARSNPFLKVGQAIIIAILWVNWFVTLTDIDRFKAGIDTSGEGRSN